MSIVISKVVPHLGRRVIPFRRVDVQPEIVEEGKRGVLQLHGRREGFGEEDEVVHELEQPGSRQSPSPANPPFLRLVRFFPVAVVDSESRNLFTSTSVSF